MSTESSDGDLPEDPDATRVISAADFDAALNTVSPTTSIPPVTGTPQPPNGGKILPGQLLGHTYEIEAMLARGGMGEVFRARHAELGSIHAIKVILQELAEEPRIISLFQEEARKLRRVRNDAVVAYEGLFRDEYGRRYLVMEFVDGPSLAQVMKQRKLTVEEVRHLRDRCAMGLGAAHEKGIYHRDISPDNIIMVGGETGQSKIIDFGIAKSTEPGEKTVVGQDFAGKYSYVSPEQLGMYGGVVDGRSDIYSLGLVLAAAARGKPLNMGNSPISVIEARKGVPDLSDIPAELHAEIAPMLEPDPANRPASMSHLPGAFEDSFAATMIPLSPPPAAAPVVPAQAVEAPRKSNRGMAIGAGVAAFLVVAGGGAYFLLPYLSPTAPAKPAPQTASVAPVAAEPTAPAATAPTAPALNQEAAVAVPPPPPKLSRTDIQSRLQAAVAGYDCSSLSVDVSDDLRGTISGFANKADLGRLQQAVAQIAPGGVTMDSVAGYVWPQCAVAKVLVDGSHESPTSPRIVLNHPSGSYRDGEKLVVDMTMPDDRGGYLMVDLYDTGGSVVHIYPTGGPASGKVRPGQAVALGKDGSLEVGPPYGPNMIVAVVSPQPLFATTRPQQEDAKSYLPILQQSLAAAARGAGTASVVSSFGLFDATK